MLASISRFLNCPASLLALLQHHKMHSPYNALDNGPFLSNTTLSIFSISPLKKIYYYSSLGSYVPSANYCSNFVLEAMLLTTSLLLSSFFRSWMLKHLILLSFFRFLFLGRYKFVHLSISFTFSWRHPALLSSSFL